jgi:uncharacterized repeat protein (TIGR01451 family)
MSHGVDTPGVLGHPIALVVGVIGVVLGIIAVAGVDVVAPPPERPLVTVAAAGLVLGGVVLGARRVTTTVDQADPPVVEWRGDVAVPGTSFDGEIAQAVHGEFEERAAARAAVVERLREAGASVLAVVERIPVERASERVDAGEWPADGSFDGLGDEETGQVTLDRARTAVGGRSSVDRLTGRAITALADVTPGLTFSTGGADPADETDLEGAIVGDDAAGDEAAQPDDTDQVDRQTGRWTGVVGAAMLAVGVGVFATLGDGGPSLVVASVAVVGAVGYVVAATAPDVSLAVERRVGTDHPEPGEEVEVTVTVENTGDGWLADLRVVDGVPAGLRVVDGSPRYATALRAGETVRFSYVVVATRGEHTFDPVRALARDPSGATESERRVDATGAATVECTPDLNARGEVPVFAQAARRTGRVRTDTAGEGVEFHSVREYQQGDPLSRVDWNRVATAGEFATLQFHEERAATVVVVVDARRPAYVTDDPAGPAVPERQLAAADRLASSLLSAGDSVGLAAFSPEWCWLEPRGGDTQRARIQRHLATHPAFGSERPTDPFYGRPPLRRLREELPGHAQLVVCSPLCDDYAVELLREFHARGSPVTVVSPDPTGGDSTGQRLAAVERAVRISRLRRSGVRVVDWESDQPLRAALDTAQGRWSG